MTLFERYLKGETKEVYAEIQNMGQDSFLPERFTEVEAVLIETFERVAYNLEIIFRELSKIGYVFFDRPLHKPLPDTELLLRKLDDTVKEYGYVPLSLKYFYRVVGGADFAWNYQANDSFLWEMADPLQIYSLDEVIAYTEIDDWRDVMQCYIEDEDIGSAVLDLSADDLCKDNASGGNPYALRITDEPSIDSDFVLEWHHTTFIDYLRICFDYCGFPGNPDQESYREFAANVRPQLKQI